VSGLDPETGSVRWAWNWTTNDQQLRTVGSPVMTQGLIFFGGGNGPGDRHTVAVRMGGKGELPFESMEWSARKMLPYVPSMLPSGEHVFFVNDSGIAGCFVARTGDVVWSNRLGGGDVTSSPLLIDDKIYVVNEKGTAFVFAADPKQFKLLATSDLGEVVRASPAVADHRLIIRGREHLFCFGNPVTVSSK
jgi:outer membrane protein assembly factor BamB